MIAHLMLAALFMQTDAHAVPARAQAVPVQVTVVTDEAEAVLRILELRARGQPVPAGDWQRLFASQGYVRLSRREAAIGRAFSDSSFRDFVMRDTLLLARREALAHTLAAWRGADIPDAARRALAYLPASSSLRANLYLEVKPRTNSFVFREGDSLPPGIFLYLDPAVSAAKFANTLAHELHHIGYGAACADPQGLTPQLTATVRWLGGFGEGLAMLAAAGGPRVHPHEVDDDSVRERWDRDVARTAQDLPRLEAFYTRILDGRLVGDDSIFAEAEGFYGEQGPFYTAGWLMWSTIEEELGRPRLIALECDRRAFPAAYNEAAARRNAAGGRLPLWSESFVARLAAR